jgi:hypothetical protein
MGEAENGEQVCECNMGGVQSTHGQRDGRRYCDWCGHPLMSRAEHAEEIRRDLMEAAGPDLYLALETLVRVYERFVPSKHQQPHALFTARAALAKACPTPAQADTGTNGGER